jgi:hypothetical protein
MFYSYLFDGDPESLDDLPKDRGFLLLSHRGFVRCVEKDVPLLPAIRSHLERRIIYGDRYSGVHYFLVSSVVAAGQESSEVLQKKLIDAIKPGDTTTTYGSLMTAQRVIVRHFEEAIALLVEKINDCDHAANVGVLTRIIDNYRVLAKFNTRYRKYEKEWERKKDSYRAVFCKTPEPVNVTLR